MELEAVRREAPRDDRVSAQVIELDENVLFRHCSQMLFAADDDVTNAEHSNGLLDRRRYAARASAVWRDDVPRVADDEQHVRVLAVRELGEALAVLGELFLFEADETGDHVVHRCLPQQ